MKTTMTNALVTFVGLLFAALLFATHVSAEPLQSTPDEVLLARTCLREAGWGITDDCAAIHAVILNRVRRTGVIYSRMIRAYSKPKADRSWIEEMDISGSKPAQWPRGLSWDALQGKWRALVKHARKVAAGDVTPACDADHWGDTLGDHDRAVRHGLTQIPCGETLNEFWVVPRSKGYQPARLARR